jgi:hypothetical protein
MHEDDLRRLSKFCVVRGYPLHGPEKSRGVFWVQMHGWVNAKGVHKVPKLSSMDSTRMHGDDLHALGKFEEVQWVFVRPFGVHPAVHLHPNACSKLLRGVHRSLS